MVNGISGDIQLPDFKTTDPSKLKETAQQFEALLIGQMLKSARESGSAWFGGGGDEASSTATGMAEEHLAQALAAQGGLGITRMVVDGLAKDESKASRT